MYTCIGTKASLSKFRGGASLYLKKMRLKESKRRQVQAAHPTDRDRAVQPVVRKGKGSVRGVVLRILALPDRIEERGAAGVEKLVKRGRYAVIKPAQRRFECP